MNSKTWICTKLQENGMDKKYVLGLFKDYQKEFGSSCTESSYKRYVYLNFEQMNGGLDPKDFDVDSVIRTEASKQKLADINNELRKTNREQYRIYNTLEEVFTEYVDLLKNIDLSKFKIKDLPNLNSKKVMIVQLSDLHMNELIFDVEANGNSYDFDIASKRLKKLIARSIQVGKENKVSEVYLFFTGDFINSSRRLGERMAMATSLVRASLLTTYLLQQAILEVGKHFKVSVASVVGNESRVSEVWDSGDALLSENWDYLIFQNLKLIFSKTPVKFLENLNSSQNLVSLSTGFNALLIHGNQLRITSIDSDIAKIMQAYLYKGTPIHGVFYGHYHSASLGDIVSRSSSLCGGNAFSTNDLKFLSRASQNIYIVNEDMGYDALKIDLQNVDNEGYDIKEDLERYNVRSSRVNNRVTIETLV